uniref:PPIase FKBP-type domain-containing protein n=1 Tax=Erpetoichthys calabaricus TaxID=27687 RepID=A0A8C4SD37_ERPCA
MVAFLILLFRFKFAVQLTEIQVQYGDVRLVHYVSCLESNRTPVKTDIGPSVWFTFGIGELIKSWDKRMHNICSRERKRTAHTGLGYGKDGNGKSADLYSALNSKNTPASDSTFLAPNQTKQWWTKILETFSNSRYF